MLDAVAVFEAEIEDLAFGRDEAVDDTPLADLTRRGVARNDHVAVFDRLDRLRAGRRHDGRPCREARAFDGADSKRASATRHAAGRRFGFLGLADRLRGLGGFVRCASSLDEPLRAFATTGTMPTAARPVLSQAPSLPW
jgi:hypothetical protein